LGGAEFSTAGQERDDLYQVETARWRMVDQLKYNLRIAWKVYWMVEWI
jgi:hypothetical protein